MTALVGATSRVGETGRRRVHVVSIMAGQVLNALVDPAAEPTIHTFRPRLIPPSARKVPGFYREQVVAMLAEVATTAIDAVALVTAHSAAVWREFAARNVPGIPVTVIHPVLAATWAEYHRRGQTGTLAHVTISSTVPAGIVPRRPADSHPAVHVLGDERPPRGRLQHTGQRRPVHLGRGTEPGCTAVYACPLGFLNARVPSELGGWEFSRLPSTRSRGHFASAIVACGVEDARAVRRP